MAKIKLFCYYRINLYQDYFKISTKYSRLTLVHKKLLHTKEITKMFAKYFAISNQILIFDYVRLLYKKEESFFKNLLD